MQTEEKEITGYPSIDKPWLKYYSDEEINMEIPNSSLYDYLYLNNKNNLSSYAINYFGNKITYSELFENIDIVAKAFKAQGVSAGDVCTIVSVSCVTEVLCFYALNRIGAIPNCVNVLASEDELAQYFTDAASKIVVTLDLFGNKVLEAAKKTQIDKIISFSLAEWMPAIIKLGYSYKTRKMKHKFLQDSKVIHWKDFLRLSKQDDEKLLYKKDGNSVGVMAHTGGTTGFPKTVLLADNALNAVACQYKYGMKHEIGDVFLNIMVPFVVYGSSTCMHMPLCLSLCVVIIPKFDATDWYTYITKYRPNHVAGIPSYMEPMLKDEKLNKVDMSCIRTIAVGGDGMNEKLETELNQFMEKHNSKAKIIKGYGMTEVCATALTCYESSNKLGSVGIPLVKNNMQIYNNEQSEECGYGEVGEVCLYCASTMLGYKDNVEETNSLFRFHSDGNRWLHTGDLGYIDEDGFLFLVGRMKRMLILGDGGIKYKVFPNVIEEAICNVEEVQTACVVSVDRDGNAVAKAYVVLRQLDKDDKKIEEKLKEMCDRVLPDYMRPAEYVFLEQLPLTAVGKIDYKALEEMDT